MNNEQLESRLKKLEDRVMRQEDIENIKKLQRAYAFYLERGMFPEIIDLFSDDTESIDTGGGVYLGKEGVKKHFAVKESLPEWLHITMPLSGIVDIDPGGKTAKARWYIMYCVTLRIVDVPRALFGVGIYENEYIKEEGKWKFKKVHNYYIFQTPFEEGWVKTPFVPFDLYFNLPEPDMPSPYSGKQYPSGVTFPFHYKHPITGK